MNQIINKVDITPLVGVALILVIVFVVTSPLIMAPLDSNIDLPKAATVDAKSRLNVTISVTPDLQLAVNEDWVPAAGFKSALRKVMAQDPERLVVIRADKNVKHESILRLLSQIQDAGACNIAFATEQRRRQML
jgi:biopolymer transport protein ExbD